MPLNCKNRLKKWKRKHKKRNNRLIKKFLRLKMMISLLVVAEVAEAEVAIAVVVEVALVDEVAVASAVIRFATSSRARMMTTISTVRLPNQFVTSRRRRT